ncbi:MAG: hypothetical protein PHV18_00115 [Lachnospiraceae bacterium]|nr:hypothetical protein [Lachnospiraceae bacterium]
MKNPKTMTYKEMENELIKNRSELRTADLPRKRELINRDHDLMTEMDRRWQVTVDAQRKAKEGK